MMFKKECEFYWYGMTWKCLRVSKLPDEEESLGGLLDVEKKTIFINECYDEESFLDYLHHELTEGALFLGACCYSRHFPDEKDFFVMDHSQMDLMSSSVRGAYEMIKKNIGLSYQEKRKGKNKKEDS